MSFRMNKLSAQEIERLARESQERSDERRNRKNHKPLYENTEEEGNKIIGCALAIFALVIIWGTIVVLIMEAIDNHWGI